MRLTFLGAGAAFTEDPDNFQSNMFIERKDSGPRGADRSGLLIDAGTDIRWSMKAAGLSYRNIHSVYISHLHADHIGGLEWVGFRTYFDPECAKPSLIATKGVINRLWDDCLKGGMEGLDFGRADLSTYFDVTVVSESERFQWGNASFEPVRVPHFYSDGKEWSSFGLMMRTDNKSTFLTTDAIFDFPRLRPQYEEADVILQDSETSPFKSGAHAHYDELVGLPPGIKKKMWLYHYNDEALPNAVADGFLGFAKPGHQVDLD